MDSSTRIADLPENITMQMQDHLPINTHPNPYGNQPGLPPSTQPSYPTFQDMQLPSRDIRVDASQFRDEATKVNYIPPVTTTDYVKEYEDKKKQYKEHNEQKHRVQVADDVFSELQMPILIAILFFIFQMPIINKLMSSTLSFLPIYRPDGNANIYGVVLKSVLFGSVVYGVNKVIHIDI